MPLSLFLGARSPGLLVMFYHLRCCYVVRLNVWAQTQQKPVKHVKSDVWMWVPSIPLWKRKLTCRLFFSWQLLCSTVQKALFEEEERVQVLSQQVRSLEKANSHLREKVKTIKRQLRQAQRDTSKEQQTLSLKQLYEPIAPEPHPDQDTAQDQKNPPLKKVLPKRLRK